MENANKEMLKWFDIEKCEDDKIHKLHLIIIDTKREKGCITSYGLPSSYPKTSGSDFLDEYKGIEKAIGYNNQLRLYIQGETNFSFLRDEFCEGTNYNIGVGYFIDNKKLGVIHQVNSTCEIDESRNSISFRFEENYDYNMVCI